MKKNFFMLIAALIAVIAIICVASWVFDAGGQQITGRASFYNSEAVSLVMILVFAAVIIAAMLMSKKRFEK